METLQATLLAYTQKSDTTKKETTRMVALFVQAFGDKLVQKIIRRLAREFGELLSPSSYAKSKQDMDLNAEVKRAQEFDLTTLSGKSVTEPLRAPFGLVKPAYPPRYCGKDPMEQLRLGPDKAESAQGIDNKLALLSSSAWTCSTISQATFAGITLVAAYSSIRLEGICNLLNEDIQVVSGQW